MINHDAIRALNPSVVHIEGIVAYDENWNVIEYDVEAAKAWVDPNLYKIRRRKEYPSIEEQLDALWKGGQAAEDMKAKIQAVKNKYPKS